VIGNIDQAWRRLEVRHLAALETTARLGSFRAAAAALGYSQSALSGQIAALEAIVGTPLLRRPRGAPAVSPTPAGRLLLDRASRIGDILASTRADLAALAAEHTVLRVGIFQSASARLLPPLVRAFRGALPDVDVRLHEALDPQELTDLAVLGELDVVFLGNAPTADALARIHLLDDPYVLLVSHDHPLAAAAAVDPAAIARLPLITYRSLRAELLPTALLPRDRTLDIIFRSDDDATVRALVAAGVGAALIPRLSVEPADPRTLAIPILPSLPARQIFLAWLKSRAPSSTLQAFVYAAVTTCAESRQAWTREAGPAAPPSA
jgi:DNA-binding transcriptional LysR family regulator